MLACQMAYDKILAQFKNSFEHFSPKNIAVLKEAFPGQIYIYVFCYSTENWLGLDKAHGLNPANRTEKVKGFCILV